MGMALATELSPKEAELEELYEIVNGQKVWPRVGKPDTGTLYEIVNGDQREIPRMGALAATIASFVVTHINFFAWPRKLGFAATEVMFRLRADRPQRRPDLAYISYDRWTPPERPSEDPPAWDVVPNLVGEVVSPNNTVVEIEEKLQDYFATGVQLVWVIHPQFRRIYVYESLTQVRILAEPDELDGGTVLPGFRLPISTLFMTLDRPT